MSKKIAVIGGGLGGLSCAMRLAADGHKVVVLEKNERAGGKLNVRSGQGYQFDTGPSILTMPWVLEQLFQSTGRRLTDYMTLLRVEPQWRTFFEDGVTIDVTSDLPKMISNIQSISEEDAKGFLKYLQYCQKLYDLNKNSIYSKNISGLDELRGMHTIKELLAMDPLRTMAQSTAKYVQEKHLRQLFNFLTMYIGSSPYHTPAVLSQLVYVQLGLGIYYVEGGMYNIAKGMLRVLEEQGVSVRTNARVSKINTIGQTATGVTLEDGTIIEADLVVSNLEAIPTYYSLLKDQHGAVSAAKQLNKFAPTVSGLVLLLGVNKKYDQLQHHNFFFSRDPEKEFHDLFNKGVPAEDPTIYIGISSKSDLTQAPHGKENLFILTHVPPLKPGKSWGNYKEPYRELVLDKLVRMGLPDLRDHIEYEHTFIPDDLQNLYGANGGSIYGVVSDRKMNGGFKIPSQSKLISNLYFVGGSTHPGGGVPMVTLSGQLTADLIKENEQKEAKSKANKIKKSV